MIPIFMRFEYAYYTGHSPFLSGICLQIGIESK